MAVEARIRLVGILVATFAATAVADPETVKGELTFDYNGTGKVMECKTGRVLNLGTMESDAYQRLVQRYWRLSFYGKTPVLIEVRGGITRSGAGGTILTLQTPNVVTLVGGGCHDLPTSKTLQQTQGI